MVLHWFRRDLRLEDNAALTKAHASGEPVQPIFIFDPAILDRLEDNQDARVSFIYGELERLQAEISAQGGQLWVVYGDPITWHQKWASDPSITGLFSNRDYEPYAGKRDTTVHAIYQKAGKESKWCKDHVMMEPKEVLKDDGSPYTVFTPYSRKWRSLFVPSQIDAFPTPSGGWNPAPSPYEWPSLEEMGFRRNHREVPERNIPSATLAQYEAKRNFPALPTSTTRLGVHLRFGTLSIRALARSAYPEHSKFLTELIWRDFYQMILYFYPESPKKAIKPAYDRIEWERNEKHFEAWCQGQTGYPLVDAGMRELNATGFMHNRVRMVVASFLTKHLLLDWRLGEAYFASKLLDFDLASNVGGWQWASGSGCDAAPYFRIFNPESQLEKFDKQLTYVKRWVPEYGTAHYVKPIIEHKAARERCLTRYKEGLASISFG
jgi:deoxyribodipyrimidine photo-lyase